LLLGTFYLWADKTELDLVTKGEGRLIVKGKNQSVQVFDPGIITELRVSEGDEVSENDLLAIINPTDAEGYLDEARKKISSHAASIIRIDAWITNKGVDSLLALLTDFNEEIKNAQVELFQATIEDQNFNMLNFSNRDEQLKIESDILSLETDAARSLRLSVEQEAAEILPLVKQGIVGSSEQYRIERELANLSSQISSLEAKIMLNAKSIEQLNFEKQAFVQNIKAEMLNERLDHVSQIEILKTSLPRLAKKVLQTEVRSPIDGIVNVVFVNSENAVVKGGEILLEIVPNSDDLQIQAYIDPKDIGKVEVGQKARISLTAYDASKYGFIDGLLTNVSADAVFREDRKDYMFMVTAIMESSLLDSESVPVPVNAGMIAQVDIIRGKQTLLEYFWQPVAKIKDDAFRQ
jgi:adhesin transport system membrane fusion protein